MEIIINLPDKMTSKLEEKWGNLSQKIIKNIALEAYENRLISTHELKEILNLSSFLEVHKLLKESDVFFNYDQVELEEDLITINHLRGIE
jgi:predicted HTH domain antitoxin